MTQTALHRSRVPHWGWWLAVTLLSLVLFVGVRFGIPLYRQQQMIADLHARGFYFFGLDLSWLRRCGVISESLEAALASTLSVGANVEVTDEDLHDLCHLANLRHLSLGNTNISAAGLMILADCEKLRSLSLQGIQDLSGELIPLGALTNLRGLNIEGVPFDDFRLAELTGLTKLGRLGLRETEITDAGLIHLKGLTQLENVTGVTRLPLRGEAGFVGIKGFLLLLDSAGNEVRPVPVEVEGT